MRPNPPQFRDGAPGGFTLIELITSVVVLAILVGIAAPSMHWFYLNQRVKNASFDFVSTLIYARNEAITRGADVSVKPLVPSTWQGGWAVWVTNNGVAVQQKTQPAYSGISITGGIDPNGSPVIIYTKSGRPKAAVSSVVVNASPADPKVTASCIAIDLSGLPSSTTGSTCP